MNLSNCLCCGSIHLVTYLDLGLQPLANSFNMTEELPTYPLAIQFCKKCSHSQLTYNVDPRDQFDNYLYVSGTSQTLRNYFKKFANKITSENPGADILEIASNDGTLLGYLKENGHDVLGIDPAKNLVDECNAKGLTTLCKYWNQETAKDLDPQDVIIAVNVLPHVPNPKEFLEACSDCLNPDGKIYIQTSQCEMFLKREFDAIYHEHRSYFTAKSFTFLANSLGLGVVEFYKDPIHATSFVFVLEKGVANCETIEREIAWEGILGFHKLETYEAFGKEALEKKYKLREMVHEFNMNGVKVVGYGASAKGNTVLNFTGIQCDYIVDNNSMKQGLYTPGSKIKVKAPEVLAKETTPIAILMLAWNFSEEIEKNISNIVNLDEYYLIKFFPEVRYEHKY